MFDNFIKQKLHCFCNKKRCKRFYINFLEIFIEDEKKERIGGYIFKHQKHCEVYQFEDGCYK